MMNLGDCCIYQRIEVRDAKTTSISARDISSNATWIASQGWDVGKVLGHRWSSEKSRVYFKI